MRFILRLLGKRPQPQFNHRATGTARFTQHGLVKR